MKQPNLKDNSSVKSIKLTENEAMLILAALQYAIWSAGTQSMMPDKLVKLLSEIRQKFAKQALS